MHTDNEQSNSFTSPKYNENQWRTLPAKQQPKWKNQAQVNKVEDKIQRLPPLVFSGEIEALRDKIALAANGKAFLLQAGDCAEEFKNCTANEIKGTLKIILQMALIITYAGEKPVIKMGRIAGQYAKPRSSDFETINNQEFPSYRGDIINDIAATLEAREPDPQRMLDAYQYATATLNLLRAFSSGGFSSLSRIHLWNQEFLASSAQENQYKTMLEELSKALTFLDTIGISDKRERSLREIDFYTSHEALLLPYESALTRQDSVNHHWYNCSAHMLWIGERTRNLDGAHVAFMKSIRNPIGIKLSASASVDDTLALLEALNPDRETGRIVLIPRIGYDKVEAVLPSLIRAVAKEGYPVLWSCDPMHANTYVTKNGYKTRNFDYIAKELITSLHIHQAENSALGGLHCEMTGKNVTECVGGADSITEESLSAHYDTNCDPRLNARQSVELAFLLSQNLKAMKNS